MTVAIVIKLTVSCREKENTQSIGLILVYNVFVRYEHSQEFIDYSVIYRWRRLRGYVVWLAKIMILHFLQSLPVVETYC